MTGLAYGTGAQDEAVELVADAGPGARAFAHFVAGVVRSARAPPRSPTRSGSCREPGGGGRSGPARAIACRACGLRRRGRGRGAALRRPHRDAQSSGKARRPDRGPPLAPVSAESGPFAGLPLHNGLCAIEVRTCATVALSAFEHRRISPAGAVVASRAALSWRVLLVELLAGLSRAQEDGRPLARGIEQVIRSQRLPVREARWLRRVLLQPRPVEQIASELRTPARAGSC